jgi:hypothetical protein
MKKAISLILMLLCGGIVLSTIKKADAQVQVVGPEYPVKEFVMEHPQPGEKKCQYFFFTTILGVDQPRISFMYTLPDGKIGNEMPRVIDVSIILDESKASPTVRYVGKNDGGKMQFELRMNAVTYADEGACLPGVVRRK